MQNIDNKDHPKAKVAESSTRCSECNFIFTPVSFKYYCCDPNILACAGCNRKICNRCKFARDRRLNIVCKLCKKTFNEDDTFYDVKEDRYYCPKCLSRDYIYHYDLMVAKELDPKTYIVKMPHNFQYGIQELIHFYRKRCFCCIRPFKESEVYQMKYGARICSLCLECNFDRVLPKLIMCVQCNGYLHDQTSIKFQISTTEVICVHCSKDQAKMYDALQRKSVAGSNKGSNLHSKLVSKDSVIVSVDELERVRESGLRGEGHRMTKIVSKISMEEESVDVLLEIDKNECSEFCVKCKSFFPTKKSLFQLHPEEMAKLRLDKQLIQGKKQVYVCLQCFNYYNQCMIKPKQNTTIRQFKTEKQLENVSMTVPNFQSVRELKEPGIDVTATVVSPRAARSPRRIFKKEDLPSDIFCQTCKKAYASKHTSRGLECITCANKIQNK